MRLGSPSLALARTFVVLSLLATAGPAAAVTSRGAGAEPPLRAAAPPPTRLTTGGGYFRDNLGRVVQLHGVNLVDKGPASSAYPNSDAYGLGFTTKDAAFLRASGFNVVRLGINWSQLLPARPAVPGVLTIDPAYLSKVVRVARLLAHEKIFFLLDLHQDCWDEWPQWAVPYDQGNTSPLAFPACYFAPNAGSRAADNLFRLPDADAVPGGSLTTIPVSEVWTTYREVWRQIAVRFRTEDFLLGYDFMNEPSAGTGYAACFDLVAGCPQIEEKIQAFEQNALDGIRAADPDGIAMFEPPSIAGTTGAPTGMGNTPVRDPNVAWTFHQYCGSTELADDRDVGCAETVAPSFEGTGGVGGAVRNAAHLTGADLTVAGMPRVPGAQPAPILLGEFGSTTAASVLAADLVATDARFMSWTLWHYKDKHGGQDSVFDSAQEEKCVCFRGASPRADVLIRPYAQATAGQPVSLTVDLAGKSAVYRYRASSSLSTEIVVPRHFASRGYEARVVNGTVTSGADAPMLTVRATSGREVAVTIVPRKSAGLAGAAPASGPKGGGPGAGGSKGALAATGLKPRPVLLGVGLLGVGLLMSVGWARRRRGDAAA